MLDPPPLLADRFVPGTPRIDSHPSLVGSLGFVSPPPSRSAGLRHATSMFGLRSLQNLRLHHHGRENSLHEDHTSSKGNNKADVADPPESRVAPPRWLDRRDIHEVPRPRTSPLERSAGALAFPLCSHGPAGVMFVEAKHKVLRKSMTTDQLPHLRHRQRQTTICIETLRPDGVCRSIGTTTSPDVAVLTKVVDNTGIESIMGSDGGESACRGSFSFEDNDVETRGRRGREWQRKRSFYLHPGPLNSNPTRNDDDSTPRATTSFTAEMQAKLNDIRGSLINRIGRPTSRWWEDEASGGRPRRSLTPPTPKVEHEDPPTLSFVPVTPVVRASAIFGEPELFVHQQLADLKSENITLKSLKKLHEAAMSTLREEKLTLVDQKAVLEATILESESKIRAQQATLDRQDSTISKLSHQLSSRDAEQGALVATFATELASRDNELIALKNEKWTLQRNANELEQMIAQTEAQLQQWGRMGRRIPRRPRMSSVGDAEGDVSAAFSPGGDANSADDRGGQSSTENHVDIGGETANGLITLDAPAAGSLKGSVGDMGSPASSFNSPFTPGTSPSNSLSGWAATTLPCHIRPSFNFQSTPTPNTSTPDNNLQNSAASISSGRRPSSRRRRSLSSQTTAVAMAEDNTMTVASRPQTSHDQPHQRGQTVTVHQRALAAENFEVEKIFMLRLNKQASLNELNILGSTKGVSRMASVAKFVQNSPSLPILPSPSTLELPILMYGRSLTVWLDRVVTTFKYLNLSSFLRPSNTAAANTSERLRAAIILKNAVNDDILEDVLFLLSRKETQSNSTQTEPTNSSSECPHLLLSAILAIHGLVSGSPSEVGWVDRISEAELGGVEDFASLVLCIDKRRNTIFGSTAEPHDSILPKIQESVAQRVPEVDNPVQFNIVGSPGPKNKSQLSAWMGGLVKRRQTRLEREQIEV